MYRLPLNTSHACGAASTSAPSRQLPPCRDPVRSLTSGCHGLSQGGTALSSPQLGGVSPSQGQSRSYLRPSRIGRIPLRTVALSAYDQASIVAVDITKTSWNSRKLDARVEIPASVDIVWNILTDYANLGEFIPSLEENKCLEKRSDGAVLYQVGAQDVAMGIKFSAACKLECIEHYTGVPSSMISSDGTGMDGLFPAPGAIGDGVPPRDISFTLLEGDFQTFKGIWRMLPSAAGNGSSSSGTLLGYTLYVMPQAWLPVGIIQNRIEAEVLRNLDAVAKQAIHVAQLQAHQQ